jgi:hypothetical protein
MISPYDFAAKQMELTSEFAQYVVDHPEVDEILPAESFLFFEVAGEDEFNRYSRELAEKQLREEGLPLVCVRIRGLEPPQRSRLIDPVIEPVAAVA